MRRKASIALLALAALAIYLPRPCAGQESGALEPFVRLYDTGAPVGDKGIADSLPVGVDWQLVPEGKTDHESAGDAVIRNDRVAILLRPGAGRAELYSRVENGWAMRCAVSAGPAVGAAAPRVTENAGSAVEAVLGEGARSLTFRMTLGEPIVGVTPGDAVEALELGTDPAYVVLPEFFADDLLYSPHDIAVDSLPVPADNQVLAMVEQPRGILMCLWRRSGRRTAIQSREGPAGRRISGFRVECQGREQVWLACLEAPVVWQGSEPASVASTQEALGWRLPFPARWRLTVERIGWPSESLRLDRDEPVMPSSQTRREIMAGRPIARYVIYPIDRTTETPLTVYCPTDVLRNTLGCGPCQYVLDTEGAGAEQQVTPDSVADWVEQQFERGRQQRRADQIEERLAAAVAHIAWMSDRLAAYERLGARIGEMLPTEYESADDPALLVWRFAASQLTHAARDLMIGGAGVEPGRAEPLAEELASLAREGGSFEEAAYRCDVLRVIGAAQDRALAKCRLTVRRIRLALDDVPDPALVEAVRAALDEFEQDG